MRRSRTVSPAWFRAHVLPLETWSSWDEAEADLLSDPDQQRRIDELAADLTASGFEHPVTMGRDRWWSRRPRVRDGIHRSITAMRLGLDIPLRFGEPSMEGYGEQDEYTVTAATGSFDELMDRVFTLASFRCADGFWLRCDTASGDSLKGEVRLLLPRRTQRREEIAAELAERLRDSGISTQVTFSAAVAS
jgi:hypothetical protein